MVGSGPLPRGEVVSKVWDYIKKQELQNPENRREILADDKLEAVFGKKKVTMFEMNKYLAQHLAPPKADDGPWLFRHGHRIPLSPRRPSPGAEGCSRHDAPRPSADDRRDATRWSTRWAGLG